MGFVLSCSTIPSRIDYLCQIIPMMKIRYKYFVINICANYKRFGEFKIPKSLLQLCKQNKRVIFNFIYDYGAVCKYIGGFQVMKKKKLYDDKLIIIDDDTVYNKDLFYELMNEKTKNNVTTGSGFNYDENRNYKIVEGATEMVEGYAGVCFDYNQCDEFILFYSNYFKTIQDFKSDDLVQKYLCASFLGDDFIISSCYQDKWAISCGRQLIQPQGYGFTQDALHKNNIFGSNMGSYNFLYQNIIILKTFKLKYKLNKEINEIRTISKST
jgi:hypothetical protein